MSATLSRGRGKGKAMIPVNQAGVAAVSPKVLRTESMLRIKTEANNTVRTG